MTYEIYNGKGVVVGAFSVPNFILERNTDDGIVTHKLVPDEERSLHDQIRDAELEYKLFRDHGEVSDDMRAAWKRLHQLEKDLLNEVKARSQATSQPPSPYPPTAPTSDQPRQS